MRCLRKQAVLFNEAFATRVSAEQQQEDERKATWATQRIEGYLLLHAPNAQRLFTNQTLLSYNSSMICQSYIDLHNAALKLPDDLLGAYLRKQYASDRP